MLRAPFAIGWPLASFAAAFSSFVPFWSAGFAADWKRPIWAYVRPPVASSVCIRMIFAKARAWSPVLTCWPAHWSAYFATAGSSLVPKVIPSCLMLSRTVVYPFTPMKIATAPKTISTAPARNPPLSQYRLNFIALPPAGLEMTFVQRRRGDGRRHRGFRAALREVPEIRDVENYGVAVA